MESSQRNRLVDPKFLEVESETPFVKISASRHDATFQKVLVSKSDKTLTLVEEDNSKRTMATCPKCLKMFKSDHFRRHLRTHKLNKSTENAICAAAYGKAVDGIVEKKECPICLALTNKISQHNRKVHDITGFRKKDILNENDRLEDPIEKERIQKLKNRYPNLIDPGKFAERKAADKTSKARIPSDWLKVVELTIEYFYTSQEGRGHEFAGKSTDQMKRFIKRLYYRTTATIREQVGYQSMLDADLFIQFHLMDPAYEFSTRRTDASDFITVCNAFSWVKSNAKQSVYAEKLNEISLEYLQVAVETMSHRRAYFSRKANASKVEKLIERSIVMPTRLEIAKVIIKAKALVEEGDFIKSRDAMLLALVALNPLRVEPFEDLTFGNVMTPFHTTANKDVIIKICGAKRGAHKTKTRYGSALMTVHPDLYEVILEFIEVMKIHFLNSGVDFNEKTNLFSQRNGAPLKQLSGYIGDAAEKHISSIFHHAQ